LIPFAQIRGLQIYFGASASLCHLLEKLPLEIGGLMMKTNSVAVFILCLLGFLTFAAITGTVQAQKGRPGYSPEIPRIWDDAAIAELEVPLADPAGSPKHISADYYYRIPVRPIYRSYAVYAPGHEPPGYMDWLKRQEPEIIWGEDTSGQKHAPPLNTEADWIKAGEIVFDSATAFDTGQDLKNLTDPAFYTKTGVPLMKGGVFPFEHYVIREKGKIERGTLSCALCHTRVMADGMSIKGAQGNFPQDQVIAYAQRQGRDSIELARNAERYLFAAPWLHPDPQARLDQMSIEEIASVHQAIPPGVLSRHRSSSLCPPHIPDLIGVKDRHYLDATGLQQHHSAVDLMRYAALNQGADDLASFDGFIPADAPRFQKLPDPDKISGLGLATPDRYSDEQLYALALYVYSLRSPLNPNRLDTLAAQGQKIFDQQGCAACHTPPLYTNNKLTPAEGFKVPGDHLEKYDILPTSVGTDVNLTLRTRRGTGYYKVPSLKGVWYRTMFEHNGSCATLEDWLDPRRVRDDYVPTGFVGYGVRVRAVKGHVFGLELSADDKKALIAFLKTL
jgi:hypothetical protein